MQTVSTSSSGRSPAFGLGSLVDRFANFLTRVDPAPRPEPISQAFAACFIGCCLLTVWLLVTNKYYPGQDISYHAHCSRVWLEAGKVGTAFERYEPSHPLEANTLMYSVAGILGHVGSSFSAYRFVQSYYFLGLPLACLYAARALGRSPWGSLLAFPLSYTEVMGAGYANMCFAAPTFILALIEYRRFTQKPSLRRGVVVALLFAATFLSHAHVYLWLGALVLLYSLCVLAQRTWQAASGGGSDFRSVAVLTLGALATAVPSLVLFARWYVRGYGAGNSIGGQGNGRSFDTQMDWAPIAQKFQAGWLQAFHSTLSIWEVHFLIALVLLVLFALGMARAGRDRSVPLPELAVIASIVSYYLLPDSIAGQMVAVRQWYFVYWLLPLVIVPIPLSRGAWQSVVVTTAILVWTSLRMGLLVQYMQRFTNEEMAGFDKIVAAAPRQPGLNVAYAAVNARSRYWITSPMYHSYGFLDAQRSYDGPVEYSDSRSVAPVRYKAGPPFPVKHLYNNPNWPLDPGIWQYDLVLVYRWVPTPAQEKAARDHADLVASAGEWQLWRTRH